MNTCNIFFNIIEISLKKPLHKMFMKKEKNISFSKSKWNKILSYNTLRLDMVVS